MDNRDNELAELQATIANLDSNLFRQSERIAKLTAENERLREAYKGYSSKLVVDALNAEIERLKGGQGEPVLIQAVAVTREDEEEGLRLEWLLEGGIAEMEFPGMVLFALPEANDLCAEDGSAEIYTSQPAPVSVVLPERLTAAELDELEVIEVLLHGQGLSNLAGTMAAARQFIDEVACLDKVKELNQ